MGLLFWLSLTQLYVIFSHDDLADDARIEPERHLVTLAGEAFPAGEFFDHFHDDHETGVRRWLAGIENS